MCIRDSREAVQVEETELEPPALEMERPVQTADEIEEQTGDELEEQKGRRTHTNGRSNRETQTRKNNREC